MPKYKVHLKNFFTVTADTLGEAEEKAERRLESYAESNDGAEMLANAGFTVEEVKEVRIDNNVLG